ncbi:MAG: hypothetical protein A3F12_04510 [Gammaproteobacteria bacterium RIFCSPHIGHO2_12_FULL_38_14]|nr:MAG: hypothetical protein A3F12_04510 [Gammaproteobacteria bacterium RIFCSPHIGHO2_12_FULL_38_14]
MFTYLIEPQGQENSIFIALSVRNDTITFYTTQSLYGLPTRLDLPGLDPFIYRFLPRWISKTQTSGYCAYQYIADHERRGSTITSRQRNDPSHRSFHTKNLRERNIIHYHLRHPQKIGPQELEMFLKYFLSECSINHSLSKSDINFLPKGLDKEIVKAFNEYVALNPSPEDDYIVSNNVNYGKVVPMPSIKQHYDCLLSFFPTEAKGCAPLLPENFSQEIKISATTVAMGVIAMGVLCKGLIGCCVSFFKNTSTQEARSRAHQHISSPSALMMKKEGEPQNKKRM